MAPRAVCQKKKNTAEIDEKVLLENPLFLKSILPHANMTGGIFCAYHELLRLMEAGSRVCRTHLFVGLSTDTTRAPDGRWKSKCR